MRPFFSHDLPYKVTFVILDDVDGGGDANNGVSNVGGTFHIFLLLPHRSAYSM